MTNSFNTLLAPKLTQNPYKNKKLPSRLHEKIIRLRKIKKRLRDLINREDKINSLFA